MAAGGPARADFTGRGAARRRRLAEGEEEDENVASRTGGDSGPGRLARSPGGQDQESCQAGGEQGPVEPEGATAEAGSADSLRACTAPSEPCVELDPFGLPARPPWEPAPPPPPPLPEPPVLAAVSSRTPRPGCRNNLPALNLSAGAHAAISARQEVIPCPAGWHEPAMQAWQPPVGSAVPVKASREGLGLALGGSSREGLGSQSSREGLGGSGVAASPHSARSRRSSDSGRANSDPFTCELWTVDP